MRGQDIFGNLIHLEPGQTIELSNDEARTFFNWRLPGGDEPRSAVEVSGFICAYGLRLTYSAEKMRYVASK